MTLPKIFKHMFFFLFSTYAYAFYNELPTLIQGIPEIKDVQWVMPDARFGGQNASVVSFRSQLPPSKVLDAVELYWKKLSPSFVLRLSKNNWDILSRYNLKKEIETLQIKYDGKGQGSFGLLSIWKSYPETIPEKIRAINSNIKGDIMISFLPERAENIKKIDWKDFYEKKVCSMLTAYLPFVLDTTDLQFKKNLKKFQYNPINIEGREISSANDRARFYQKEKSQVLLTLHRQKQGTDIVLYKIDPLTEDAQYE